MTALRDLVEVNPPTPCPASGPIALIRMADVDADTATATPRVIATRDEAASATRAARPNDVLLARISPSMENGKVAIVPDVERNAVLVSGELLVLRPKPRVDPRVVWAFFRRDDVRRHLRRFMTGSTGQQRISPATVQALEISPTTDCEAALAALDHLDRARALGVEVADRLERLPAAAARCAAEGAPRVALRDLGVGMAYGTSERAGAAGAVPVVGIPNVVAGWVELSEVRYVPEHRASPKHALLPNDLLVVRTNGNAERLGRAAVYEGEPEDAIYASYLLRLRGGELDPDYLWAWLRTAEARQLLFARARTSAGQYNLSIRTLGTLPVPQAPRECQAEVGALARVTRRAWRAARRRRIASDALVQSHLSRMFESHAPAAGQLEPELPVLDATAEPSPAFAAASEVQQRIWQRVSNFRRPFTLTELCERDEERAAMERTLMVLEQLGVLVRERTGHVERWRQPEPESEVVG